MGAGKSKKVKNSKSSERDLIHIAMLGSGGVGKSALTVRYVQNVFVSKYDPTIEDSYRSLNEFNGKQVMLEILDTAGYAHGIPLGTVFRENRVFLVIYSVIAPSTFEYAKDCIKRVVKSQDKPYLLILVANKTDLTQQRQVSREEGEQLAEEYGILFFETTAKLREIDDEEQFKQLGAVGVKSIFNKVLEKVMTEDWTSVVIGRNVKRAG